MTEVHEFLSVTLQNGALEKLENSGLVNDTIINYLFAILREKVKLSNKKYYFVNPDVTAVIQNFSIEESRKIFKTNGFSKYSLVFFPITDVAYKYTQSHYSLICWQPKMKVFYYFDTLKNRNLEVAKKFIKTVDKCLRTSSTLKSVRSPQQNNSIDCGVYIMAMCDYLSENKLSPSQMIALMTPQYISKYREYLAKFIKDPKVYDFDWSNAKLNIQTATDIIRKSSEET